MNVSMSFIEILFGIITGSTENNCGPMSPCEQRERQNLLGRIKYFVSSGSTNNCGPMDEQEQIVRTLLGKAQESASSLQEHEVAIIREFFTL